MLYIKYQFNFPTLSENLHYFFRLHLHVVGQQRDQFRFCLLDFNVCDNPCVVHDLLSVVASFLCFLWWNVAVKKIGALPTSNYVYLNPITTIVASALFLQEPMTLMAYIGSALILIGVFIANREVS